MLAKHPLRRAFCFYWVRTPDIALQHSGISRPHSERSSPVFLSPGLLIDCQLLALRAPRRSEFNSTRVSLSNPTTLRYYAERGWRPTGLHLPDLSALRREQ